MYKNANYYGEQTFNSLIIIMVIFDLQSNTYIDKRIERGYGAKIKVRLSDLVS